MINFFKHRDNAPENKAKARCYSCKFLEEGLVGYSDEIIKITNETISRMASSFKGCPVIVNHDNDLTEENFVRKSKGYVTRVEKRDDGWYCDFTLHDANAIKDYEENGYNFVSCAYVETEAGEGGTLHNIPYKEEVKDGFFTHLALTRTPRYEDARIFANSKSEDNKEEHRMFGIFKVTKADIGMDALVETSKGKKSIEELVKFFENSVDGETASKVEEPVKEEVEEEKPAEEAVEAKEEVAEVKPEEEVKTEAPKAEEAPADDEPKMEVIEEVKPVEEVKENATEEKEKNKEEEKVSSETEPAKEEVLEEKTEGKEPEVKENSVDYFAELNNARENSVEDEEEPSVYADGFQIGSTKY